MATTGGYAPYSGPSAEQLVAHHLNNKNDAEQFLRKGIAFSVVALLAMVIVALLGIVPLLYLAPVMLACLGVIISFGVHLNAVGGTYT